MSLQIAENSQEHWGAGSHVRWAGHPTPLESYQLFMSPLRNQVQAIKAGTQATSTEAIMALANMAPEITPELLWGFWRSEARHLELTPLGTASGPNSFDPEAPAYARKTHLGVTLTSPEQRHLVFPDAFLVRMNKISEVHAWLLANKGAFLSEQHHKDSGKQSRLGKIVATLTMPMSAWLRKDKSKVAMSPAYAVQLDAFFQLVFDYGAIEMEWDKRHFAALVPDTNTPFPMSSHRRN